jgi:glycosyltransferase involved in cell wall biosynthesis
MKLVLTGRLAWKNGEFLQLLKTYKYRKDVLLTNYISEEELVQLMGAAYALVYPSFFEGFGVPVLEGMKCGVPVLTSANTSMQEIGEDAALYFNPADHTDIADKLMLIYKDENLRNRLIEKGKAIAEKYSWQRTADLLWESVLRTAEKS